VGHAIIETTTTVADDDDAIRTAVALCLDGESQGDPDTVR